MEDLINQAIGQWSGGNVGYHLDYWYNVCQSTLEMYGCDYFMNYMILWFTDNGFI